MSDLIEALQIFMKYGNRRNPTNCDHDVLAVIIDPNVVSDEDKKRLDELGFKAAEDEDCFISFRFGSC